MANKPIEKNYLIIQFKNFLTKKVVPLVDKCLKTDTKSNQTIQSSLIINKGDGTTTTKGISSLTLGNNKKSDASENSRGRMYIYGADGTGSQNYYSRFQAGALTVNRDHTLPDKSGTIALTSDIPEVPKLYNSKGTNSDGALTQKAVKDNYVPLEGNSTIIGNIAIDRQDGTTTGNGMTIVTIGNGKAAKTDGNSRGGVRLYGRGNEVSNGYSTIVADNIEGSQVATLPNATGTIVLDSTISDTSISLESGLSKKIELNGNLNDYIKPGTYYCGSHEAAMTIVNSPTSEAFKLIVDELSTGHNVQIIMNDNSSTKKIYIRNYDTDLNPVFGAWYTFSPDGYNTANHITYTSSTSNITATSLDDAFVCPSEGYIILINNSSTLCNVRIYSPSDRGNAFLPIASKDGVSAVCYVRAGMRVYNHTPSITPATFRFYSLS